MRMIMTMALMLSVVVLAAGGASAADGKIKVLVVTGGHGFQQKPFYQMFEDNAEITFAKASQGKSSKAYDRDDLFTFDVVVLYDMVQNITDKQKERFLALFDKGIGVVALHHCIASYQNWPKFENILGAKYLLKPDTRNGVKRPKSAYDHVDMTIKVLAENHPITQGLEDFEVHDEIYLRCPMAEETTKLLGTSSKRSMKYIGWCHKVKKSPFVYLESGHGPNMYKNPHYRKLLANAIRWAANK